MKYSRRTSTRQTGAACCGICTKVPGHSPDSIVYDLPDEGIMFTGDVIFAGSIGRTDLPGGNLRLLKQGIEKKVLNQPATTMIFPGHGPYTTVKNELLTNPFIS